MSKKVFVWLFGLSILCLIALGFSIIRVIPCTVGNDTYIGTIVTLLGIIVTFVIGYQIFNIIEFRDELHRQKEENKELLNIIKEQNADIIRQKSRVEEGIYMNLAFATFNSKDHTLTCIPSFILMMKSLTYALDSKIEDLEEIFNFLTDCISSITGLSFNITGCIQVKDKYIIASDQAYKEKTVDECIDEIINPIRELDKGIKNHAQFPYIQHSYTQVMQQFDQTIIKIKNNPLNQNCNQ